MSTAAGREMPRYQSRKKVWALKIAAVEFDQLGAAKIAPADEGYATYTTEPGWRARFKGDEADLGYFVLYEDGYSSWSPSAPFEAGHTRL